MHLRLCCGIYIFIFFYETIRTKRKCDKKRKTITLPPTHLASSCSYVVAAGRGILLSTILLYIEAPPALDMLNGVPYTRYVIMVVCVAP